MEFPILEQPQKVAHAMMPFSVLRSFFLSLVSWAILGVGVYLAYDAYRSFNEPGHESAADRVPDRASDDRVATDLRPLADETLANDPPSIDVENDVKLARERLVRAPHVEDTWQRWAKLAGAILCLGLTFGGRLPVRMLMQSSVQSSGTTGTVGDVSPDRTITVSRPDGSQLHVETYGSEQKPTLILTHGWSLDSSAWKYMRPSLTKDFRVVVWDLPGLGKSVGPKNNDYTLEKMACDLNAVIEQVSPNGPVVLIGHSIGGMIQQTYCRLHHDKLINVVKGIVLVHTTYTNPVDTNMLAGIVKPLEPIVSFMNWIMIPLAPLVWLSNWQSYYSGSAHWAARLESFTGKQTWHQLDQSAKLGAMAWPSVLARGNFGMMKFNEEATLPNINIPVLVVSSHNDRLTTQSASKHIEQLLPNDTPIEDKGGHLGHWEYNSPVSEAIVQFAKRVL